ncbi:hypothetical protein [Mycoplasma sp. 1018B]|uniref:hypothetical protein n=1 Tax=Mycoplasma sp. 1018B TaxID=2967302 RepID=UPI00211C1EBA|nr:hypothetical protein [Mycoplasma sp. 1018B]UUM19211.1 hypothetical protein NPA14_02695 [Mycoplasma sp. 1018B]
MDKKLLFSLENYFERFNNSYFAIKKINIYQNISTVFYIKDQNNFFFQDNCIKKLISSKKAICNFILDNKNNSEYIFQNKKILNYVKEINLNKMNNNSQITPILFKYFDFKKNYQINLEKIKLVEKTFYKYKNLIKKIIFNSMESNHKKINYFIERLDNAIKKIKVTIDEYLLNKDPKIFNLLAENDILLEEIFNFIFNILDSLNQKLNFFINKTKNAEDFLGDTQIKLLDDNLKYLEIINKKGETFLINQIEQKSLQTKLNFYKNLLKNNLELKNSSQYNAILNWYRKNLFIKKQLLKYVNKNSSEYYILYKKFAISSFLIKLIKKHKNIIIQMNKETLNLFHYDLAFYVKLFISNNLSIYGNDFEKAIKHTIKEKFYFNFERYQDKNERNLENILDKIISLKNELKIHKRKQTISYVNIEDKNNFTKLQAKLFDLKIENEWKNKHIEINLIKNIKNNQKCLDNIDLFYDLLIQLINKYKNFYNKIVKNNDNNSLVLELKKE